jgi:hypothetical protein
LGAIEISASKLFLDTPYAWLVDAEPLPFIQWKLQATEDWKPSWENFQKPEKTIVHTSLIVEQGHICCYCGQRITQAISHIEHFQPRTHYPDLSLSYNNFLASCPGYPEAQASKNSVAKLPQEFCGQRKGSWFDLELRENSIIRIARGGADAIRPSEN